MRGKWTVAVTFRVLHRKKTRDCVGATPRKTLEKPRHARIPYVHP
ncbi:hypothetical protein BIFADO_00570 [Bifidobacterium adolescentis L2-32]|uniref:Uncharacterized protein n=1 Tax=Bifidobacterium adolescentis L2-32 TaxID=411481 RepID=A7A420_BIFAD|nr:hypothetical protein BIFADO_00570 [Bifidobacterium adolescentis L2-32]